MKKTFLGFATLILLALSGFAHAATASPIGDSHALRGVSEAKGVFLIDFSDPKKTAFYLGIIQGTHANLLRQGVKPDFVIVYIGPTVRFLTRSPSDDLILEYEDSLKTIAKHVAALDALGVRQEVCAVATQVFGVDDAHLLPGLALVGDGFVSLIGWQTQGYKLVPLF